MPTNIPSPMPPHMTTQQKQPQAKRRSSHRSTPPYPIDSSLSVSQTSWLSSSVPSVIHTDDLISDDDYDDNRRQAPARQEQEQQPPAPRNEQIDDVDLDGLAARMKSLHEQQQQANHTIKAAQPFMPPFLDEEMRTPEEVMAQSTISSLSSMASSAAKSSALPLSPPAVSHSTYTSTQSQIIRDNTVEQSNSHTHEPHHRPQTIQGSSVRSMLKSAFPSIPYRPTHVLHSSNADDEAVFSSALSSSSAPFQSGTSQAMLSAIQALQSKLTELRADNQSLTEQLISLQQRHQQESVQHQSLLHQTQQQQQQQQQLTKSLQQQLAHKTRLITQMKQQISLFAAEFQQHKQTVNDKETKYLQRALEYERLSDKMQVLKLELKKQIEKLFQTQDAYTQMQTKQQQCEVRCSRLTEEKSALKEEQAAMVHEMKAWRGNVAQTVLEQEERRKRIKELNTVLIAHQQRDEAVKDIAMELVKLQRAWIQMPYEEMKQQEEEKEEDQREELHEQMHQLMLQQEDLVRQLVATCCSPIPTTDNDPRSHKQHVHHAAISKNATQTRHKQNLPKIQTVKQPHIVIAAPSSHHPRSQPLNKDSWAASVHLIPTHKNKPLVRPSTAQHVVQKASSICNSARPSSATSQSVLHIPEHVRVVLEQHPLYLQHRLLLQTKQEQQQSSLSTPATTPQQHHSIVASVISALEQEVVELEEQYVRHMKIDAGEVHKPARESEMLVQLTEVRRRLLLLQDYQKQWLQSTQKQKHTQRQTTQQHPYEATDEATVDDPNPRVTVQRSAALFLRARELLNGAC